MKKRIDELLRVYKIWVQPQMTMTDLSMIVANTRLEMKRGRKTYTEYPVTITAPAAVPCRVVSHWSRNDIPALQMFLVGSQSISADGSWLLQHETTNAVRPYGLDLKSLRAEHQNHSHSRRYPTPEKSNVQRRLLGQGTHPDLNSLKEDLDHNWEGSHISPHAKFWLSKMISGGEKSDENVTCWFWLS